jgi:hypothetical protein
MNKALAIEALNASIARGCNTPCSWAPDRDTYISEKFSELLGFVIDPVEVQDLQENYNYGIKDQLSGGPVFAIASSNGNWLLYSPTLDLFAVAQGDKSNNLTLLGFASNDALTEWLG